MFKANRTDKSGGGVAIWTNIHLNFFQISPSIKCHQIEVVWLVSNTHKFIVCGVYIPPNITAGDSNEIKNYIIDYFDYLSFIYYYLLKCLLRKENE